MGAETRARSVRPGHANPAWGGDVSTDERFVSHGRRPPVYRRELLGLVATSMGGSVVERSRHSTSSGETADGERPRTTGDGTGTATRATDFAPLGSLPVEGAREAVVGDDGSTVFVAAEDGFAVVAVADPADPRLLAERRGLLADDADGPMAGIYDVAVDGDRLLVMGPAHAGIEGPRAAILYDVADPTDPRRVSVHRTDYPIHNGTLRDGLAYLTANGVEDERGVETNPLAIVAMEGQVGGTADGTGEVGSPRPLGTWSPVNADDAWADVPAQLRPVHDVIVQGDVAYCSYWDAGTWLVDVLDPAAPRAIGHVAERSPAQLASVDDPEREDTELPGNHHSAAIDESGSLLAIGHEAWDADDDADDDGDGGPGGIDLVDVSDPGTPRVISTVDPPSTGDTSTDGAWTTAHNFELRDGHLYSAWYRGGVRVHDVTDPRSPREVAAWRDDETRFWTAQVAAGAGDSAVVASSTGLDDGEGEAGLFAFPDPVPVGASDPSLRQVTTGEGSVTGTRTEERRVVASPGLAGFGADAALAGGGLAWLLARRRTR